FRVAQWVAIVLLCAACIIMWCEIAFGWRPAWADPAIFAINAFFLAVLLVQIRKQRRQSQ
ncbi:MAG TPA: hypothetical protein VFL13_11970, partial [Candidatus Baltobacteraceae bacterium]|nr:hypothetical protein [Candidatus Baltobacteraceae bacterium]